MSYMCILCTFKNKFYCEFEFRDIRGQQQKLNFKTGKCETLSHANCSLCLSVQRALQGDLDLRAYFCFLYTRNVFLVVYTCMLSFLLLAAS